MVSPKVSSPNGKGPGWLLTLQKEIEYENISSIVEEYYVKEKQMFHETYHNNPYINEAIGGLMPENRWINGSGLHVICNKQTSNG